MSGPERRDAVDAASRTAAMKSRRGWSRGTGAKPASDCEIRYGFGLLGVESSAYPPYVVVGGRRAYDAAKDRFNEKPIGSVFPNGCDFDYVQTLIERLPQQAELVVGLGGGLALDVSKHVALVKELPLILVPSIVSTGAIIHGFFARWKGRYPVGGLDDWPWVDCEHVLIDYDVVLSAPDHLNAAGIGDVLCMYAGLAEWRRKAKLGTGPSWDEQLLEPTVEFLERTAKGFPATFASSGELTSSSVRFIAETLKERDSRGVRHPAFVSADHHFLHVLELVNDRSWIHGEIVALGATIIAWLCNEGPERLVSMLDQCGVRRRPTDIGVGRDELERALVRMPSYLGEKEIDSVLCSVRFDGTLMDDLWAFLESS